MGSAPGRRRRQDRCGERRATVKESHMASQLAVTTDTDLGVAMPFAAAGVAAPLGDDEIRRHMPSVELPGSALPAR